MDEIRYEYRDARGSLRYTIVRHGHGLTKQFEVLGRGGESLPNPLPAERRILYRLPEVLAAPRWETIYVAEGEKDTVLLGEDGFVATTMPFGTRGGWLPSYTEHLRDRHVVVLPDNDGPGRRHGAAVREALCGTCASVLLLTLGGSSGLDDVTTWFQRRRRPAEKLRALIRRARYRDAGLPSRDPPQRSGCIAIVRRANVPTLTRLMLMMVVESGATGRYQHVADLAEDCGTHRVTCQNALRHLQVAGIVPVGGVPDPDEVRWDLLAVLGRTLEENVGSGRPGRRRSRWTLAESAVSG